MNRQIVAVRMSGGEDLHHIAGCAFVYRGDDAWKAQTDTVGTVISEIESRTHTYFTRDWRGDVADVHVVKRADGSKYLRTVADGVKADNLLRLPRYGG
jgi:hypothetical protein